MAVEIVFRQLEPVDDPAAFNRALQILLNGFGRALATPAETQEPQVYAEPETN